MGSTCGTPMSSASSRRSREPSPDWPPVSEAPVSGDTFDPAEIEPRARWAKISSGGCAAPAASRSRPSSFTPRAVGRADTPTCTRPPWWASPLRLRRPRRRRRPALRASSLAFPVQAAAGLSAKRLCLPGGAPRRSLLREIRYLRQCGPHPNIVQLYGSFREAGRICLVMEHAKYVLRMAKVVRSVNLVGVLSGVARAMVRLHACGIIHRDIKSRNVLVTSRGSSARAGGSTICRRVGWKNHVRTYAALNMTAAAHSAHRFWAGLQPARRPGAVVCPSPCPATACEVTPTHPQPRAPAAARSLRRPLTYVSAVRCADAGSRAL